MKVIMFFTTIAAILVLSLISGCEKKTEIPQPTQPTSLSNTTTWPDPFGNINKQQDYSRFLTATIEAINAGQMLAESNWRDTNDICVYKSPDDLGSTKIQLDMQQTMRQQFRNAQAQSKQVDTERISTDVPLFIKTNLPRNQKSALFEAAIYGHPVEPNQIKDIRFSGIPLEKIISTLDERNLRDANNATTSMAMFLGLLEGIKIGMKDDPNTGTMAIKDPNDIKILEILITERWCGLGEEQKKNFINQWASMSQPDKEIIINIYRNADKAINLFFPTEQEKAAFSDFCKQMDFLSFKPYQDKFPWLDLNKLCISDKLLIYMMSQKDKGE